MSENTLVQTDKNTNTTAEWTSMQPWFLTTLSCLSLSAVIINIIHIIILSRLPKVKSVAGTNFRIFIMYLAAADLSLSAGRLTINNYPVQKFMYDYHWACVTSATVLHSLNVLSVTILALASLERLVAVYAGVNYSHKLFAKHYPKTLALSMLACLALYVLLASVFQQSAYSVRGASACALSSDAVPWLDGVSGIAGLLSVAVIVTSYCLLLCKIRMSNAVAATATVDSVKKRSANLNRTVGALILIKLLMWVPIIFHLILKIDFLAFPAAMASYLCSNVNPLLYGLTTAPYRKAVRQNLPCLKTNAFSNTTTVDKHTNPTTDA